MATLEKEQEIDKSLPFRRQGSIRKVLPSLPNTESQLIVSAKMIDRPAVSNRGIQKAYSLYQQEYSLISEYNMLRKQELPGIYVIPSAQSSLVWFGVLFVRTGIYQGGVFRFTINIPESFPDGGCPSVIFQSKIFHPLVNEDTGELDVKTVFSDWRKNVNRIWQVVHYIRRAFYKIECSSPVNKEASDLYETNQEVFLQKVKDCVQESINHLYDAPPVDDPHYISFEPYNEVIHGPVRDALFRLKDSQDEPVSIGLSWVQPGSLQPFSKPSS